jgi:hypothetical protein
MKLGRNPRTYDARIPHLSAVLAGQVLSPPPISVDYTKSLPSTLGMMLNDTLGDCTCAAYYHARQVWSFNANKKEITESDSDVKQLYEKACGYDPANPTSDSGGVEQDVLTYLLNNGAPIVGGIDKILGFVEVDPRNLDDIKRTINDCGVVYIGITVPNYLMDSVPDVWDTHPSGDNTPAGGHAIVLAGYDLDTFTLISWGRTYKMTNRFFAQFTDEAYGIADAEWVAATGKTPGGLSLSQLETQMAALKDDL